MITLLSIVLLTAGLVALLNYNVVQKRILQTVLNRLSEKTQTQITISGVDLSIFPRRNLEINNLLILDKQLDTLIFSKLTKVDLSQVGLNKLTIEKLHIANFKINCLKDSVANTYRYRAIIDSLLSPQKKDTSQTPFQFDIKEVLLENGELLYENDSSPKSNLKITNLNTDVLLNIQDSSKLNFKINSLSLNTNKHFQITYGKSDISIEGNLYLMENTVLKTAHSELNISKCYFDKTAKISSENLINDQIAELNIQPSKISSLDLAALTKKFSGPETIFNLNSVLSFSSNHAKLNKLELSFKKTNMFGTMEIKNYKNFEEAYISTSIDNLSTNQDDLLGLIYSITGKKVNEMFGNLGIIHFSGDLEGLVHDFAANGQIQCDQGTILSDVAFQNNNGSISLEGNISSTDLNLGVITNKKVPLDSINMNAHIVASRINTDSIECEITGHLNQIFWNQYLYKQIDVNGRMGSNYFSGDLSASGVDGELKFQGDADLSGEQNIYNFAINAKNLNLYNLHLINKYPEGKLSFNVNSDLNGSNLGNIDGAVEISGVKFFNGKDTASIDMILFESNNNNINIYSDIAKGNLTGTYAFDHLNNDINSYLAQFSPKSFFKPIKAKRKWKKTSNRNNFQFSLTANHITPILKALNLNTVFVDSIGINGYFNGEKNDLKAAISISNIDWSDQFFSDKLLINLYNDRNKLSCNLDIENFRSIKYTLDSGTHISLKNELSNDRIANTIHWLNNDSLLQEGLVKLNSDLQREGNDWKITTKTSNNPISINSQAWGLNFNQLTFSPNKITVDSLILNDSTQTLLIHGVASKQKEDHLNIKMNNLQLGYLSNLFGLNKSIDIAGDASGSLSVHQVFNQPFAYCNISVQDFYFNQQYFDLLELDSDWKPEQSKINISTKFTSHDEIVLAANGYYDLEKNWLTLDSELKKLHLTFLRKFLQNVLQDIDGQATGKIKIIGPIQDIDLIGGAYIDSAHFNLDYIKTSANFSDSIFLSPLGLLFPKVRLTDAEGNKATLRGSIKHNAFSDMEFDLRVNLKNYKVLGTKEEDNPTYYGTAYATGICTIKGDENLVTISSDATTNSPTHLYIPLDQGVDVGSTNFITFVDKRKFTPLEIAIQEYNNSKIEKSTNLAIDLRIRATEDAKVELIFEKTLGNIIKGQGEGDITIKISPEGDFKMYGDYEISSGDYLLTTFQSLINKKFEIRKGGSITWSGAPYEADINLDAEYKLKTSITNLLAGKISTDNIRQRVNVVCGMNLSGKLSQPNVKFEITLPNSDSETQRLVYDLLNSTDDMSKQVAYLLLTNQFYTGDQVSNTTTSSQETGQMAAVTVSELLSNQLSGMISKMNENVAMGVYYRPSDALSPSEMEVSMSTQLLNNRVTINGNVGYSEQTTSSSNFIGDFDVELKLIKSGKLLLKTYTHTNDYILQNTSPTTQGIGLVFKEDFNSFTALLSNYFRSIFGKKEEKTKIKKKNQR